VQHSDELRIFIAEDSASDALLIEEALAAHGVPAKLKVCQDGETALSEVAQLNRANLPDLIILDLNLPRIDGMQLLRHVRGMSLFDDTPVMVFTSSESLEDREKAKRLGANAYFTKPRSLDDFLWIVASTVRKLTRKYPPPNTVGGAHVLNACAAASSNRNVRIPPQSVRRPVSSDFYRARARTSRTSLFL